MSGSLRPGAGQQQNQHRVDFQSAEEHVEAQNNFGQRAEHGKVSDRSRQSQTGTDVIERCKHGCDRGRAVEAVERHQKNRQQADEHVQNEIPAHRPDRILPDDLAVDAHDLHRARMNESAHLDLRRAD